MLNILGTMLWCQRNIFHPIHMASKHVFMWVKKQSVEWSWEEKRTQEESCTVVHGVLKDGEDKWRLLCPHRLSSHYCAGENWTRVKEAWDWVKCVGEGWYLTYQGWTKYNFVVFWNYNRTWNDKIGPIFLLHTGYFQYLSKVVMTKNSLVIFQITNVTT